MRTGTVVTFLAFIADVHAKEQAIPSGDTQESDAFVDQLVRRMTTKLFDRMQELSTLQDEDLDNTALGKPAQLSAPTYRMSPMVYASMNQNSVQVPRAPVKNFNVPDRHTASTPPQKQDDRKFEGIEEDLQGIANALSKPGTWKAMERASKALADGPAVHEEVPYSMNFYVQGGNLGEDGKLGDENMRYMEDRIESALRNFKDEIVAVDVRLQIEGNKGVMENNAPRTYHLETTVKTKYRTVALSSPKNDDTSFMAAVDHMHDTLKAAMVKQKEKFISKKKHAMKNEKDVMEDDADEDAAREADQLEAEMRR